MVSRSSRSFATPSGANVTLWFGVEVVLVAFGIYVYRLASHPYLLDSAELAAAAFGLGVAHPPGEPLALLLGKAACFLPLGPVAFRVGLVQAAAGACAAGLVYLLSLAAMTQLDARVRPGPTLRAWIANASALAFAWAPGMVDNATRPEVYALSTVLALAATGLALQAAEQSDPRFAFAAAFVLGLGMGSHPLVVGGAGLGAVAASLPLLARTSWARRWGLTAGAVAAFVAGALVLLYVPARAQALLSHPDGDTLVWGDARSLSGWWWVVSARTFAGKNAFIQSGAEPASLPFVLMEELGLAGACLALVGFYVLLRFRRIHTTLALLLTAGGAMGAALVAGFDPHNPDIRGYLGPALAILAVGASVAAGALVGALARPLVRPVVALVTTGLLVQSGARALAARPSLAEVGAPARWLTASVGALYPRTTLLTAHFETAFLLAYLRVVEGVRPDVTWVHLGFGRSPGYAARMQTVAPAVAPVFAAHARGPITTAAVDALGHPLAMEGLVPMEPALARGLSYAGALWHWPPRRPEPEPTLLTAPLLREAEAHRSVRGFVGWRVFQDARLACTVRHPMTAHLVKTTAALLPDDLVARQLREDCGPSPP
ncbi:MAG: DUF2723 domain-containing protein [Myxococcales bacterium]|nr:DUF2723 domain-containing protein [Myxococcales bacterium]